ncbi:MAG: universal stress protein [Rhodomicrobium sp.]
MNRILVATDGSEGADRAVDYAAHRAKADGAELVIVNVAGGSLPEKVFKAFTHSQQAWFEELLSSVSADILAKAAERARSIGVSAIHLESRTGDVAETLIEIAQEKQANAIVAGKRGAGRVAELLLGSVSQKLVSLAPLPVTIIP